MITITFLHSLIRAYGRLVCPVNDVLTSRKLLAQPEGQSP